MVTAEQWEHMSPEEKDALPPHLRWRYVLAHRRAKAGLEGIAESDVQSVLGDMLAIVSDGFGMPQDCLVQASTDECAEVLAAIIQIANRDFRFPKPAIAHTIGWETETMRALSLSDETLTEVREWVFDEWERTPDAVVPPPTRVQKAPAPKDLSAMSHRALIREVVKIVSRQIGVHPEVVMGRSRTKEAIAARAVAMAAMKTFRPRLSTTQIGALFERDHSTVVHNLQKVQKDATLQALQREVLRKLTTGEKT